MNKLQKLKDTLEETIKLSHKHKPLYMGSTPQLIAVLKAAVDVVEDHESRLKALEEKPRA